MDDLLILGGLLLAMTLLGSLAGLFLKRASGGKSIRDLAITPWVWLGGASYGLAAILNIIALRLFDYSVVLPLTSITYVWTLILARIFLGEVVTLRKSAGVGLILLGAVFLTLW